MRIWVGAHADEGRWKWVSDGSLLVDDAGAPYTPYKSYEQANATCAAFHGRRSGGWLVQESCDAAHGFACEMPESSYDETVEIVSDDPEPRPIAPCSWMQEWCTNCRSWPGVWSQQATRQTWNYEDNIFAHGTRQLQSMKIGDYLTVLFVSLFIASCIVKEMKQILADQIVVRHLTLCCLSSVPQQDPVHVDSLQEEQDAFVFHDPAVLQSQLSQTGTPSSLQRLSLSQFLTTVFFWCLGTTRKLALVPCVALAMPVLMFAEGAFSLQVAMNGVALLFLLDIDDLIYAHLLSEETKNTVEDISSQVQVLATEKRMLLSIPRSYLLPAMVSCSTAVWSVGLKISGSGNFNSVALLLVAGGLIPMLAISPLAVAAHGFQRDQKKNSMLRVVSVALSALAGLAEVFLVSAIVLFNSADPRLSIQFLFQDRGY